MTATATIPRLRQKYLDEVRAQIMEAHSISNIHAAPGLEKVVVSMGVGEARENKAVLDAAAADMTRITGQMAQLTKAKHSVSNFKLREGMPIGCRVTLRGPRMWEFLDRLISVTIPRIKDFRGLKRQGFDGRGNFSFGLSDQSVFAEIDLDRIKHQQGMNITVVMSSKTDAIALDLLERLGMPFRKPDAEA